jgi:CheY-like chemotaxis protein
LRGSADNHSAGKQAGFVSMLNSQFQFENGLGGPQVIARQTARPFAALCEEQVEESGVASQTLQSCTRLRVLFVEDDPADIDLLALALRKGGFEASHDVAETAEVFAAQIRTKCYDVILADYNLPSWNGMATVEILRREGLDIPVVLVSGALGETRAVECIKQGAADYVLKDHLLRLPEAVRRAVREKKLREEHRRSLEELARSNRDLEQFATWPRMICRSRCAWWRPTPNCWPSATRESWTRMPTNTFITRSTGPRACSAWFRTFWPFPGLDEVARTAATLTAIQS